MKPHLPPNSFEEPTVNVFARFTRANHPKSSRRSSSASNPRRLSGRLELLEDRRLFSISQGGNWSIAEVNALTGQPIVASGSVPTDMPQVSGAENMRSNGVLATSANSSGLLTPEQVRHAYGLDAINSSGATLNGSGQTIAIVDAFDDPTIWNDLAHFDAQFGLAPPPQAAECWFELNGRKPPGQSDWAGETALDVEWAHAMAPGANILLVHSWNDSPAEYFKAVDWARQQAGVSAVSMSYGISEFSGETAYDSIFTTPGGHQGVTFIAAAGDRDSTHGYYPNDATGRYPSSSPNAVSVGATALATDLAGDYLSEGADPISGGGLSPYEGEPAYQRNAGITDWLGSLTAIRATPDVAWADAPSNDFGVPIYDSYQTNSPEFEVCGTSASAPEFAGLVATANEGRARAGENTLDGPTQTLPLLYQLGSSFHDITQFTDLPNHGSPAFAPKPGYDLVSGLGSPIGSLLVPQLVAGGFLGLQPGQSPAANSEVPEGSTFSKELMTFADPNGDLSPGSYSTTIYWGDNTSSTGTVGFDANGELAVFGSHEYTGAGEFPVTVNVHSPRGSGSAAAAFYLDVLAPPLQATGGFTVSATEGTEFSNQVVATFTDPVNSGNYSANVDFGDGSAAAGQIVPEGGGNYEVLASHNYASARPTETITVTIVRNSDGESATTLSTANVTDLAIQATGGYTIQATVGAAFSQQLVATFTDPANSGNYSANVDFGDGSSAAGQVVPEGNGTYEVLASHTYTSNQPTETITITVTRNSDGGHATAMSQAVVTSAGSPGGDPMPSNLGTIAEALANSAESYRDFVTAAYEKYLGRAPDPQGLDHWVAAMQQGMTDEQLESHFLAAAEYIADHGGNDVNWVIGMYHDLLGRAPDSQGLAWWTGKIEAGEPEYNIALGIAASGEREAIVVQADYSKYVLRSAGQDEVNSWVNVFLNGARNEDVIAGFVASPEYYGKPAKGDGNRTTWLDSAFEDIYNRLPTDAELAQWLAEMNGGTFF